MRIDPFGVAGTTFSFVPAIGYSSTKDVIGCRQRDVNRCPAFPSLAPSKPPLNGYMICACTIR